MPSTIDNPVLPEEISIGKLLIAANNQDQDTAPSDPIVPDQEQEPIPKEDPNPTTEQVKPKKASKEPLARELNSPVTLDEPPVNPHLKVISEKPDGDQGPKAMKSWAEVKAENKRLTTLLSEKESNGTVSEEALNAERAEKEQLKAELEEKKLALADLEYSMMAVKVEASPKYKANVSKPIDNIRAKVTTIAAANDADQVKLYEAITEPDEEKRSELIEELTEGFRFIDRQTILKQADKYHDEILPEKTRLENQSSKLSEEEQAKKAAEEVEFTEHDRQMQNVFVKKTWNAMEERNPYLRPIQGEDAWNNGLDSARRASVETNLDSLNVETRSMILSRAAAFPLVESAATHYRAQIDALKTSTDAKIAELQSQLDAMSAATPSIGGRSPVDTGDDAGEVNRLGISNFGRNILQAR